MYDLKELIQLLHHHGVAVCIPAKSSAKPTKELLLYRGMAAGTYGNDRTAATELYQSIPEDTRYTKLKARLEKKLLHHLFLLDLSEADPPGGAETAGGCEAQLYQARTLLRLGKHRLAERLLNQTLRTAQTDELTPIAVACLELLLERYAEQGDAPHYHQTQASLLRCQ